MNTEANTEQLIKDLKAVAHDAEALIKVTAGEVGERAREARTRLVAALQKTRESCQEWEEKARAGAKATDKLVRDHPYQSIGIALGLGVLVGLLVSRR